MAQKLVRLLFILTFHFSATAEVPKIDSLDEDYALWALVVAESQGTAHPSFPRDQKTFSKRNLRAGRATFLNLSEFNFSESDLRGVDFTGSDLRRANFAGSDLRETVFLPKEDTGVFFDAKTKLPFAKQEALRRKWVEKP